MEQKQEATMADLTVRRNGGEAVAPTRELDPWRMMRRMLRWDPFGEMQGVFPEEDFVFSPAFEVKETKTGFIIHADLPGVKEKDLDVSLTGNRLTIRGKRDSEKKEQTDTYYVYERSYGSFTRAFTLPEGADPNQLRAELREGVLDINIGKKPEMQAKKIAVKTEAPKG
jgi:HSP20 family protein